MEKIWIKKEFYFSSYIFLKFLTFVDFNLIFDEFLTIYLLLKLQKKGVFNSTDPVKANVARGTYADATRHPRPRGRAARANVRRR